MKERFWQKCFPVNLAQNFKHNFFTEHHSAATISLETYSDLFILYSTKIVKIQEVLYIKARFPLGDKWRYLAIIFWRHLTIILKTSAIRFTYIKSEFWSSFDIMSDSEGKDILFLQLAVLFKMKKKKRRKRKKWER